MDRPGDELAHYGVKGMKWGVRKQRMPTGVTVKKTPGRRVKTSGGENQPASKDAVAAAKLRQRAKKSTTDSLSNVELQDLVRRMNLEQQYRNLAAQDQGPAQKFVQRLVKNGGLSPAEKQAAKTVKTEFLKVKKAAGK